MNLNIQMVIQHLLLKQQKELEKLTEMKKNNEGPFDINFVKSYLKIYESIKNSEN